MTVGTPERRLTARQRQAQKAAKANGYVDRNLDGMPDPDTLSKEELASEYAIAYNVITQDPELLGLFEQAFNDRGGQWTNQRFKAAVQNSQWYKQNNRFYRQAWLARARKDADWETLRENAKLAIVEKATEIGEQVDGARLEALADDYIFGGWGEPGRQSLLNRALAGDIAGAARPMTTERGAIGNITQNLRTAAFNNGLTYDDGWYRSAARSVQSGLSTEEDWMRDINEKAAGMFPVFSKQIQAGQTAYNLASPYIRLMSEILEIPVSQITLNDPYIRGALGGFTPDGQPQAMNLGDFARKLRNDPRWKETDQAQNEITGTAGRILQMFGMMGG
jgi:hypothetical protein